MLVRTLIDVPYLKGVFWKFCVQGTLERKELKCYENTSQLLTVQNNMADVSVLHWKIFMWFTFRSWLVFEAFMDIPQVDVDETDHVRQGSVLTNFKFCFVFQVSSLILRAFAVNSGVLFPGKCALYYETLADSSRLFASYVVRSPFHYMPC
jgi:hypothetical protein